MKILVAEKDQALGDLIATRLEVRGLEVITTAESLEALRILDRERVDVVILSSQMERVGTSLLIEAIRKRSHLTSLPVILVVEPGEVAELVMSQDRGYDDFLVKPFDPFVLQLRVTMNTEKAKMRSDANALTHLPGNHAIEKVILQKIESGEKFSVLYIDINHFKAFNDHYSFEKGDDVLRQTAKLLVQTAKAVVKDGSCFVGHIGGDDFIVVLKPEREEEFARTFIGDFNAIVSTYYQEEDRERGAIRVTNRRGRKESFPLMSCSVAACTNLHRNYKNLGEIARDAMEVKAFLKSQEGSHYLRDRRTEPLGGFEEAMRVLAPALEEKGEEAEPPLLGQILLQKRLITEEELTRALKEQFRTGQKLGEVLTSMKFVSPQEVGRALEKKLNVPYVSLKQEAPAADLLPLLSMDFIKHYRVVPLEKTDKTLRIGMCDPEDGASLESVRLMTGLSPEPVLIMEEEFLDFVSRNFNDPGFGVRALHLT